MLASPAEPPKIDWSLYKNKIAIPGMVDNFEKMFSAVKIPYPEDKYSAAIDKHEKEIVIIVYIIQSLTGPTQQFSALLTKYFSYTLLICCSTIVFELN